MNTFDIDAYSPAQMALRVEKAGITKGNMDGLSTLVLAMLAGAFIAFGALLYTFVIHDATMSIGMTKLMGGLVFCLGLILVIVAGAELFTGNNLIVMAYVSRKVSTAQLLRNWGIVFVGNLAGALVIVWLVYESLRWRPQFIRAQDRQCQGEFNILRGVVPGHSLQRAGVPGGLAMFQRAFRDR